MQPKTFVPPSLYAQLPANVRGLYAPTPPIPVHKARLLTTSAQTHPAALRRR